MFGVGCRVLGGWVVGHGFLPPYDSGGTWIFKTPYFVGGLKFWGKKWGDLTLLGGPGWKWPFLGVLTFIIRKIILSHTGISYFRWMNQELPFLGIARFQNSKFSGEDSVTGKVHSRPEAYPFRGTWLLLHWPICIFYRCISLCNVIDL